MLYFSATVISLTIVSSVLVYLLFSEYREEEFQQRQSSKIKLTIDFLGEYQKDSEELTHIMDKLSIHDFFDEKMLVFDNNKDLIYKSVDDLSIAQYKEILHNLSPATRWIETKEGNYDLIGVYIESGNSHYYALSKAYDAFGYSKLDYLRNILIIITLLISAAVIAITYYLSDRIAKPLTKFAEKLTHYDINEETPSGLTIKSTTFELKYLTEKFNQLIKRTNAAFSFQKNTIHYISHELKTPLAVMVSELEKAKKNENKEEIIDEQIVRAKSLGEMVDVLLEISKTESGQHLKTSQVRVDELIFSLIEEWAYIYPNFLFNVHFKPDVFDESKLTVKANKVLIKQAFSNLLENSIKYAADGTADIEFDCTANLSVQVSNKGKTLTTDEKKLLFQSFFRGQNNKNAAGFGLGLVLTSKIVHLHKATINYNNPANELNVFRVEFGK